MVRECAIREGIRHIYDPPEPPVPQRWMYRLVQLPVHIQEVLRIAELEAAYKGWDVHFQLGPAPFVAVWFEPSNTENVRFYEW